MFKPLQFSYGTACVFGVAASKTASKTIAIKPYTLYKTPSLSLTIVFKNRRYKNRSNKSDKVLN